MAEGTVRGRGLHLPPDPTTCRQRPTTLRGGGAGAGRARRDGPAGRCPGSSRPAAHPWAARGQPVAAGLGPAPREAAPPPGVTGRAAAMELPAVNLKVGAAGPSRSRASLGGEGPLRLDPWLGLRRARRERAARGRAPAGRSGRAARGFPPGRRPSSSAAASGEAEAWGGGVASRGAGAWPGLPSPLACLAGFAPGQEVWRPPRRKDWCFQTFYRHMGARCKSSWSL